MTTKIWVKISTLITSQVDQIDRDRGASAVETAIIVAAVGIAAVGLGIVISDAVEGIGSKIPTDVGG